MAKRRGLTMDEKRERMLAIFHEKKEAFNMKEVEKYSVKAGIVLPTVKDVLQNLMSDDLVDTDKIGSANFFWSLPSKTYQTLKIKIAECKEKAKKLKEQEEKLISDIEESKKGKEESKQRSTNLEQLEKLKATYDAKVKEMEKYKRNDPERKVQLETEIKEMKKKANDWTDKCQQIFSYLQQKGLNEQDINDQFAIPADLDTIA